MLRALRALRPRLAEPSEARCTRLLASVPGWAAGGGAGTGGTASSGKGQAQPRAGAAAAWLRGLREALRAARARQAAAAEHWAVMRRQFGDALWRELYP